ncbi:molybdenum ABC transporter ATP-binding protein [Pseudooceanicola sp. CBS1P-1]|uniref:Molybdenum ABC transporter ATP-binding protein n=1 Tax=Pseudooceanicola albus TaxID=2692189 RepID=A0A6L7GAE0_9RHOB|nr:MULTISPECIES: molybdenum ABC transporter ATP-binding protein [Pseudooceanicola]MBT9386524.1 molybdenum ABC transporter ATP-binding protein [Pseudooceanicola endophyticus]MXN20557.1 molybdenum ABC transporter ATP-binding protein [Pseudooceanicola albus]
MTLSVRLRHGFGGFALDIAFEAPPGLTVLFGRSGSGKTTVINAVSGLLRPESGRIAVDDTVLLDRAARIDLPVHRRRLGYIFQDARLFPHMSVRQNLGYGRFFAPRAAPGLKPDRVIEMLGIGALLDRRPGALSGGEKSRVAIGRALLARPRILLADEPLAALDEARKAEILPYFERLRDEVQIPILYVSHSATEVARLATTIVALKAGRVERAGPARDLLADPAFTPTGIRDAGAILSARIVAHHPDGLTELDAGGQPLLLPRVAQPEGQVLRIRIAAQDVILSRARPEGLSALNILPGTVAAIRTGEGPGALVSLQTPAGLILARLTRRSLDAMQLAPGTPCHAVMKTVAIAPDAVGPAR